MGNDDKIRYYDADGKEIDYSEHDAAMFRSMYEDPHQIYKTIDWDLRNLGLSFDQLEQGSSLQLEKMATDLLKQGGEPLTPEKIEGWVWQFSSADFSQTPNFLLSSFVVVLFTMFEKFIGIICKMIKEQHNAPISAGMIRGNIVERSQNYLVIFGKFRKQPEIWKTVSEIYTIRNIIVHNNYDRKSINNRVDRKNLNSLVKKKSGISIESDTISIEKKFRQYSLKTLRAFFQSLKDEHLKRLPGQKPYIVKKQS